MATNQPQTTDVGARNVKESVFGVPAQALQFPRFNEQQQKTITDLLKTITPQLEKGQDFGPIAEQRRSQFYEQEVPTLAERFSTMGKGAQRGSGFQQAATQAGAGLQRELSALEQQFGQQKQQQLTSLLGSLLSPPFENILKDAEPGWFEKAGSWFASWLGGKK